MKGGVRWLLLLLLLLWVEEGRVGHGSIGNPLLLLLHPEQLALGQGGLLWRRLGREGRLGGVHGLLGVGPRSVGRNGCWVLKLLGRERGEILQRRLSDDR